MHDSSGLVAAAISSRSLNPHTALNLASMAEFLGPFLFGTAVAETIAKGLVDPSALSIRVIFVAIISTIIWNLLTWYLGLPSSTTHALLGGLIGAVVLTTGCQALILGGFVKVILALSLSPLIGLVLGFGFMQAIMYLARGATPHINVWFKRIQVANVVALALSHGTNDGQKSMGLIAIAIITSTHSSNFGVPIWVTFLCATALTLGVRAGGWRIIRTIGSGIYRLRPVHAFAAQTMSAIIILGAALIGAPVSATQVVSTSIIGVGSADRISAVRWMVAGKMISAWIFTIPATAMVAAIIQLAMNQMGI
jgi:inorganic phosphate transporter, PiT family